MRNNYHVKNINTLEELVIWAEGYIDLEITNMIANAPMSEFDMLWTVVALNKIRHELGKTLATFNRPFHRSAREIDQKFPEEEICRFFYKSHNKASKKLRKNYHVKDINTMEKLTISV